jgi:ElaB/YqjD/DUF883 family membrane-anchored ribosome-binding protein
MFSCLSGSKEKIMPTNTTADKVREGFGDIADQAKGAAVNLADRAKDTASNLADKAKDAASTVTHKAEDLAKTAGRKADDATAAVGHGIRSAAETVRNKGPHDGMFGSATSAAAGAMESTGRFIEEEKLSGMAEDMTNLVRRNPIPALFIAVGVGFLLGRFLKH